MDLRYIPPDQKEWAGEFDLNQSMMTGLDEDIERVIFNVFEEFEKTGGPRFKTFTEIWHHVGFGLIWCGREKFREMFEFTEEMLDKVKKYAMSTFNKKPNNQLVRFAAIYMLYSLYFKQPCRPMVKIRLVLSEMRDLQATVDLARQEKHWDVTYAWVKLFSSHAFHYVACPNQLGLEVALQMETREATEKNAGASRENYFNSKEYLGIMKKLNKAHTKYVNLKNSLANPQSSEDSSLYLTESNFPTVLKKQTRDDKPPGEHIKKEESVLGNNRRDLKYKFYEGVGEDEAAAAKEAKRKATNVQVEVDEEWTPEKVTTPRSKGKGKRRIGSGRTVGSSRTLTSSEISGIKKLPKKDMKSFMSDDSDG